MLLSGIILVWQEFDSSFQRNQLLIIITNHHRLIHYDLGVVYICNFTLYIKDMGKGLSRLYLNGLIIINSIGVEVFQETWDMDQCDPSCPGFFRSKKTTTFLSVGSIDSLSLLVLLLLLSSVSVSFRIVDFFSQSHNYSFY